MERYPHKKIEAKWRRIWQKTGLYKTPGKPKNKSYVLDMFPYPSGDGLHVGHPKGYIATDVYSRMKRMQGRDTLHPMGWDAFGLPAENYAIANKMHPGAAVRKNIRRFKSQLHKLGFNYDWSREINTTDPAYYKWTQWIFLQMFHRGLAYRSSEPINWCPSCQTGLANEDLEDGRCERCGSPVEKRPIPQWMLRITDYADRLLSGLDELKWPEHIKESQRNWIGKSEGAEISFTVRARPLPQKMLIGTTNPSKIEMIKTVFPKDAGPGLVTLHDIGKDISEPEEGPDFRENARRKALHYFRETGIPTLSTDHIFHLSNWTEDGGFIAHIRTLVSGSSRPATDEEVGRWVEEYVRRNGEAIITYHYAVAYADEHGARDFTLVRKPYILQEKPHPRDWPGFPIGRYMRNMTTGEMRMDEPLFEHFSDLREGFEARFGDVGEVKVFTTRPDTLFGATYLVLSPEHPLVKKSTVRAVNFQEVSEYAAAALHRSEIERGAEGREKTGVALKGLCALHPATGEKLPLWVADYVLGGYGTGAIMAVPAHDERDFQFAKKYGLPVRQVICGNYPEPICPVLDKAYLGEGHLVGSGAFDGMLSREAREKITARYGRAVNAYKLRDWVFSRQRYWGEPFPLVFCERCKKQAERVKSGARNPKENRTSNIIHRNSFSPGELANPGWVGVPEKRLPVKLPVVARYEPTGTGESPLAAIPSFVRAKCPRCGGPARRETNTMPQWAGSSWYYIAYCITEKRASHKSTSQQFVDLTSQKAKKMLARWLPVDIYVGGAEHATRHLIYARFWHKFLHDIGIAPTSEPFWRLHNVGLILASDGRKMGKRYGNVINPDDIVERFGADALRLYEMFMGPFGQSIAWSEDGLVGARRFIERVWKMRLKVTEMRFTKKRVGGKESAAAGGRLAPLLHRTIKKVGDDIEAFRFNTAVSSLMILQNALEKEPQVSAADFRMFLVLLAPFTPHLSEELWESLGEKRSIHLSLWPAYDEKLARGKEVTVVVQINGKVRGSFTASRGEEKDALEREARSLPALEKWLLGKTVRRVIVVPDRLVNLVV